ncbi:MAG: hypothetical protein L6R41_008335 [Letrouitia leprolyta]|nr:MAG: hypothetical protein L6R41_008335 [Letrouitia leprolyta]
MSRPTTSRATTGTAANPARRNLFHSHHLIRRPTGPSTTGGPSTVSSSTASIPEMRYDDSSDILMRDQNGDPQVQMPQLLPVEEEQSAGGNEESLHGEKERLEERLLETYKSRSFVPSDKMELLSAVQASLRRKVTALDEYNWMYEGEETQLG